MAFTGPYQKSASGQSETDISWASELEKAQRRNRMLVDLAERDLTGHSLDLFRTMRAQVRNHAAIKTANTFSTWRRFCSSKAEELFLMALIAKASGYRGIFLLDPQAWEEDPAGFLENRYLDHFEREMRRSGRNLVGVMMRPASKDFLFLGVAPGNSDELPDRSAWTVISLAVECGDREAISEQEDNRLRMRFTNAEFLDDPMVCVNKAFRFVSDRLWDNELQAGEGRIAE